MIIVRDTIPTVNGNVHRVRASHEAKAVDHKPDLGVAGEFMRLCPFNICVRAVTANALGAEQRDTEDEIGERLMCAHAHTNSKRLSRFEYVGRNTVVSNKLD